VFYLRAIAAMAANGLLAVEMEAAALYAFASARSRRCAALCAHHEQMAWTEYGVCRPPRHSCV